MRNSKYLVVFIKITYKKKPKFVVVKIYLNADHKDLISF